MASSTTYKLSDLTEYRRKVIFEHLSPETTRDSLIEYLSEFPMERCKVPYEGGKQQGHALVTFSEEASVDNLISKRPHKIDGQFVELYRSVPDQGSLKEKKGIKNLIVSDVKKGLVSKLDLEKYFSKFGTIKNINMNYDENSCCIEFDDYDAVDKVLLHRPHIIRNIEVHLTKGNRYSQSATTSPKTIQTEYSNNHSVLPRRSILKQVQIDLQISSANIPKKIYCIHIKNLPSNADAEILSMKFDWPIENIIMNSSFDNQSLKIECWLKGIDGRRMAEDFVQHWNGQEILRSKIECVIEEDKLEFCYKFRNGTCTKKSDYCDWEHIVCTENGKCSNECPYGHKEGDKTGFINRSNETYRIKITGFQKKLTPEFLNETLYEKRCYVDPNQDRIGYIREIKTTKYARRLMAKWHNKTIDGQQLKCQIELDSRSAMPKFSSRFGSMLNSEIQENDSRRFDRSYQQFNSTSTSRDSFIFRENSDPQITTLDDQEFNNEGRLVDRSDEEIIKQKHSDTKGKSKSAEYVSLSRLPTSDTPNGLFKYEAITTNKTPEDSRKMSVLPKKTGRGSLAFLVEYKNADEESYYRELNALKLLKGVKGVVQLIELENSSNNGDQQFVSKSNLSIVTEYAPGYSLKEFINRVHRGGLGVLQAIQLVQNLITIVKQVHSKGVLHQNLRPENIMIEWDPKYTPIDQAQLKLIDFSQAYIKSDRSDRISQSTAQCWSKAPQSNVESLIYSLTIDTSSICDILLWLLTNIEPRYDSDHLPHERPDVEERINRKITEAIRSTNLISKQVLKEIQLKTYLIDTFNIGFGYPRPQRWCISDLACRLESICELLSPRNPKMNAIEPIFQDLLATSNIKVPTASVLPNSDEDIFQKASNAFQKAKTNFSEFDQNKYTWGDGSCIWLDNTQTSTNERQNDDILTYFSWKANQSRSCSIIITCLATVDDSRDIITLSIGSTVNGKMSRIPIGRYGKNQNYINEFEDAFISELKNLIISICKERRAIL